MNTLIDLPNTNLNQGVQIKVVRVEEVGGRKARKKRKLVHPSSINDFSGGKRGYQKTSIFNSSSCKTL
jgi:hypothetical protein